MAATPEESGRARFAGKRIVVTGGTGGIGLAGVRRIVAEGGAVVATGTDLARITALASELPSPSMAVRDDAGAPDAGAAIVAALASVRGGLDGLWLNAGIGVVDSYAEVSAEAFDRVMAINVRGPMLQLAALSPHLNPGASIVITASASAYDVNAATGLYGASKAAVIALGKAWALALAPRGIRVNTIIPGPIETNFRDFLPAEAQNAIMDFVIGRSPLARIGSADEAAAVGLFLLSDDAAYVTGSEYSVDGGLCLR